MRKQIITKEQIIVSAASIITEKGLENSTVDDIAKRAGIAKGSIYVYFKTRDEIFIEAIKYVADLRINKLKDLLSNYSKALDKLKVLLKANQKMAESQPEIFFMNYALIISTHRNIRTQGAGEYFKKYLDFIEEIIKDGINKKEIKKINPRVAALILILTQDLSHIFNNFDKRIISTKGMSDELIDLIKK